MNLAQMLPIWMNTRKYYTTAYCQAQPLHGPFSETRLTISRWQWPCVTNSIIVTIVIIIAAIFVIFSTKTNIIVGNAPSYRPLLFCWRPWDPYFHFIVKDSTGNRHLTNSTYQNLSPRIAVRRRWCSDLCCRFHARIRGTVTRRIQPLAVRWSVSVDLSGFRGTQTTAFSSIWMCCYKLKCIM